MFITLCSRWGRSGAAATMSLLMVHQNVKRAPGYKLKELGDDGQIHTEAFSYLRVASGCSSTPPPPSAITLAPIPDNKAGVLLGRQDFAA